MDGQPRHDSMLAYWLKYPRDLLELQAMQVRCNELKRSGDVAGLERLEREVFKFMDRMIARFKEDP